MGSIVTFYSFKGGVGRSMALSNVAVLLAQSGCSVLIVDWDLEAPGLHRYFDGRTRDAPAGGGLLNLLLAGSASRSGDAEAHEWRRFVSAIDLPGANRLDILTAGPTDDARYLGQLQDFDWETFFGEREGGQFIESLRNEWRLTYDFVLIDSRTGFTDAGGVCTIQLPDVLVTLFTANHQSLEGVTDVVRLAQEGRRTLAYERMPLTVLPLLSRWDGRVEVDLSKKWMDIVHARVSPCYETWLPSDTPYRQIIELTRIPHVGKYAFGEVLPVLTDSLTDPEGAAIVYYRVARLIQQGFVDADEVLLGRPYGSQPKSLLDRIEKLYDELENEVRAAVLRERIRWLAQLFVTSTLLVASLALWFLVTVESFWLLVAGGLAGAVVTVQAMLIRRSLERYRELTYLANEIALERIRSDSDTNELRRGLEQYRVKFHELQRSMVRFSDVDLTMT